MHNHPDREFYLQYRPDFDHVFKRFSDSLAIHDAWIKGVGSNNLGDINRLYFLYQNIQNIIDSGIAGSFAELGVYKGNSAKLMHMLAPERSLYLFDTFEGFSKEDLKSESHPQYSKLFKDTSLDYVKQFVGEAESIFYIEGHFPASTTQVDSDEKFSFVHLDCDLYDPIKAGLEYFYPRVVPGGMIVIHDYASGYWPGVKKAVDKFFSGKPESLIYIPDKSGTVATRKINDGNG